MSDDCELDDTLPNISIQEPNASIADQSNCQDNRLRVTYLHRLMKEYDQRSEMNKQQIENIDPEIINYQPNAYDINDENIELDAKQKRLLKMIAGNSSGNFPILKPELDRFYLLEKSNRLRYNYPPECCTETYKQLLREAAPNITDSKITTYAMSLTDQFRFKVFFDQIPSIELKKQILDSFLLNCLTFKSTLKLHHAYGLIEGVLDDTSELSCSDWYISDMLLLKFFVSLGLDVNRFKATFPNILEVFTDCDTEEKAKQNEKTQDNKQVDSKIFEMSLRHILRLTRNSIIKRLTLYENQEFNVIFYLMCAVVLDANIENDESIQEEVGDIFEQLFNLDFLDIDELSATLIKGLRLNNQTIAYHRLVYLIKRISTKRKCTKKLSDFSTHFALSCLYSIFKEFTNEVSTVNEELSTPKMVDLIIGLLEKHSIDIYKDSSYKMFNIIELLTILVNSYILNLENANVYIKRLMNIIENAIHSVRDHIYDLGIIQVKIILSHFTDKCDNFLDKYKVDEQMDTSLSHSLIE